MSGIKIEKGVKGGIQVQVSVSFTRDLGPSWMEEVWTRVLFWCFFEGGGFAIRHYAQLPMTLTRELSGSCLKMPLRVSSSLLSCSTLFLNLSFSLDNSMTFCWVSALRIFALSLLFLTAMLFLSLLTLYSLLFLSTHFLDLPLFSEDDEEVEDAEDIPFAEEACR